MDHHCPWVNNCVGIGNHKFFIQFISYVLAISVYALVLVLGRVGLCMAKPAGCSDAAGNALVVFLVIEVSSWAATPIQPGEESLAPPHAHPSLPRRRSLRFSTPDPRFLHGKAGPGPANP